jgi:hypothetical protein
VVPCARSPPNSGNIGQQLQSPHSSRLPRPASASRGCKRALRIQLYLTDASFLVQALKIEKVPSHRQILASEGILIETFDLKSQFSHLQPLLLPSEELVRYTNRCSIVIRWRNAQVAERGKVRRVGESVDVLLDGAWWEATVKQSSADGKSATAQVGLAEHDMSYADIRRRLSWTSGSSWSSGTTFGAAGADPKDECGL